MSAADPRLDQMVQQALENARTIAVNDRLSVGDELDVYRVTCSEPARLEMAVESTIALVVFVAGVLVTVANVWLFRTGYIHFARLLPAWGKGALIGLPIVGMMAIFLVGRSLLVTRERIEKRRLWVFKKLIDTSQVAAIRVLQRAAALASDADHIEVALVDPAGAVLLARASGAVPSPP